MQRSITHQKPIIAVFYTVLFMVYMALSSIYLFLPPMFGVLFILFSRAVEEKYTLNIFLLLFCLVSFEAEKGYVLFSSVIFFILLYRFVIPKLNQNFSCKACIVFMSVLLAYIGFYIFNLLLANIFLFPFPSMTYYVVYYIVIEYLIACLL